jgi:aminoglycoside 3-N-acetyltransferase I
LQTEIQIIQPNKVEDLNELVSVFAKVFEMEGFQPPGQKHLQNLLEKKNFFAVIAKMENKVVAGLTVYVLDQYYSEKPLAYIYDLAVLTAYQRKGLGKRLIAFTNNYCRQQGYEEVFVQADKADDYAIEFYRSTKPTSEEQVVHFNYRLSGA